MNTIKQYWPFIAATFLYFWTAAVNTMPPKGTKWDRDALYNWFFDFAHMTLNSRNERPTLPATPPAKQ